MPSLDLDQDLVRRCRDLAERVVMQVMPHIHARSSVSIERAALRLVGVSGLAEKLGPNIPLVNYAVEQLQKDRALGRGALYWVMNALIAERCEMPELCRKIASGETRLSRLPQAPEGEIAKLCEQHCAEAVEAIDSRRSERDRLRAEQGDPFDPAGGRSPLPYVIVATGNIFEDVVQARAAAQAGASAIAVIRSTAQSLLDYVPEGFTTEGFGGTYATQANFRIMREALDEAGRELGRYIRLTNYSSGLCMSEIAALAAVERLDFLLNDAMYGILFRDINMQRTLVDQNFSRRIIARADIVIHTGEDNYLTTADAFENGHQVLASQFINERFAKEANMRVSQMGLGHAAEMDPWHPEVLSYEIARAQMTRDIFPGAPIKFMPPTRHKAGDIFFSHLLDCMFNLTGVMTRQSIQLLGMPTEAMHTPLLMDRWMSLKNANYIFGAASGLADEIQYKPDGKIASFAGKVLRDTHALLESIAASGLFEAISGKAFANVARGFEGGKGLDGVFLKEPGYMNPLFEML